jgi:tyrosine-protein kinase Etk/Wzc
MNERIQSRPNYSYATEPAAEPGMDLRELISILLDAKWLIAGIAAAVLFVALLYAVSTTPIYRANVLLQVNEDNSAFQAGAISEPGAGRNNQSPPADAQIAIMRSRYVIGEAVDKLGLTIGAKPDYLRLIGPFMARHYNGETPAPPFLWFSSRAWGGEKIKLTRLNVPKDWVGKPLTLVAGTGESYTLYGPKDEKLLTGQVGQPVHLNSPSTSSPSPSGRGANSSPSPSGRGQGEGNQTISSIPPGEGSKKRAKAGEANQSPTSIPSPSPLEVEGRGEGDQFPLFVAQLKARPGTHFTITKRPRLAVINGLQSKLSISETGKGTNIVRMSLDSAHPQQAARTLNAIAAAYIEQNVQNDAQQARESLKFLKRQLPKLKAKLDAAQTSLSKYQAQHQALDVSADTNSLLDRMVYVQQQLSTLKLKEADMSGRFNAGSPDLQAIQAQVAKMQQIKMQLEDRIKGIPAAQQEIFRLKRNVEVDNSLYMTLRTQAQQMRVTQAGTVGNARVIDHAAVPLVPVKPKKSLIAALGLMLGLMLGVLVAFVRKALNHGIDNAELIEQEFGLPVYATVPRSDEMTKQQRIAKRYNKSIPILAKTAPNALAIEALRGLRTSLQFALMDARNNVVAIGGLAPSSGKSFICANLAHLLADAGKHVLLIDGDMRKGHLHQYFEATREPGLSQVLSGDIPLDAAVHHNGSGADTLFSGPLPPNPSELLMSSRFADLLKVASKQYDFVLIEAPPALAVTDGAIIAKQAGANFIVLRAGQHAVGEIKVMLRQFEQVGATRQSIIFNDVTRKASSYSTSKYGHQYQYEYK